MSELLNFDYRNFARKSRTTVRRGLFVRRTIVPLGQQIVLDLSNENTKVLSTASSDIRKKPLDGQRNLLNFKTLLYLRVRGSRLGSQTHVTNLDSFIDEEIAFKAGLVGSSSGLGRAVQGVGTYLTPGNISSGVKPIRSRVYSALVPGGIPGARGVGRLKPNVQARCPSGFEFGGRFTNSNFTTCGAQLFEIPGPLALLIRGARRLNNKPDALPTARVENLSEVVEGQPNNVRTIQIQRMAQIPRTGALRKDEYGKAITEAITTLKKAPAGEGRMIRRDGVVLRPVVPSSVLRSFSGNPDMEDGAMIRAMRTAKNISPDDLALLGGASMSQIHFVAPNGVVISIKRQRQLSVGERRKFPRMLNSLAESSDPFDVTKNIREFAENSQGAFVYSEDFGTVLKPLEFVTFTGADGIERRVTKWVYETFIKANQ